MYNKIKIIAVTNRKICGSCNINFEEQIKIIANSKIFDKIILREKDLTQDNYEKLACKIQKICNNTGTQFFVNSFSEIAEKINSDGLQLPYKKFLDYNKNNFNKFNGKIAVSVHSVGEAEKAAENNADFLIAGHIFETECKKGLPPRGIEFLKNIVKSVDIPVYAIGGINAENAKFCIDAGAAGVCVMSEAMKFKFKFKSKEWI